MGVRIHLVRHAQGFHNLNIANHALPDPSLTPLGETQCLALSQLFPSSFASPSGAPHITHLIASPLRRTLYTCLLSFPSEVQRGLVITALPELQETSSMPCDTGSEREKLEEEFPREKVDFKRLERGWNSNTGKWAVGPAAIRERAREARLGIREIARDALRSTEKEGDVEMVVVTHGAFLHYLTQDWTGYNEANGTAWKNAEFRSYEFADLQNADDDEARMVETRESLMRRRVADEHEHEQKSLPVQAEEMESESGLVEVVA